jgi:predicted MFS family arabinose efflux permease
MTKHGQAAAILFACTFAAQSGQLVLTPVLTEVAAAFHVSTAGAGQVRTVAALVAVVVALTVGTVGRRLPRRTVLLTALGLGVVGSATSAAATSLALLGAAQILVTCAMAVVVAAAVAAAAEWSDEASRARVVAWTIVGAPSSWIVTMPLIGALADVTWRLAFVLPVATGAIAVALLVRAPRNAPSPADGARGVGARPSGRARRWALGELLFNCAWGGTLLYAGALVVDSYGSSAGEVGIVLGLGAAAYLPGTFLAKEVRAEAGRAFLAVLGLSLAVAVLAFGTLRTGPAASAVAFAAICFLAGARQYFGNVVGLELSLNRNVAMALKAAAGQGGWLIGSAAGGAALAAGGYPALVAVLAGFYVAGAFPYAGELIRPLRGRTSYRPAECSGEPQPS